MLPESTDTLSNFGEFLASLSVFIIALWAVNMISLLIWNFPEYARKVVLWSRRGFALLAGGRRG